VIVDQLRASVLKSSFSKCVSNVVWETLSRARYAIDEKLAWEGGGK
jgi:hypothetical protein